MRARRRRWRLRAPAAVGGRAAGRRQGDGEPLRRRALGSRGPEPVAKRRCRCARRPALAVALAAAAARSLFYLPFLSRPGPRGCGTSSSPPGATAAGGACRSRVLYDGPLRRRPGRVKDVLGYELPLTRRVGALLAAAAIAVRRRRPGGAPGCSCSAVGCGPLPRLAADELHAQPLPSPCARCRSRPARAAGRWRVVLGARLGAGPARGRREPAVRARCCRRTSSRSACRACRGSASRPPRPRRSRAMVAPCTGSSRRASRSTWRRGARTSSRSPTR